MLNFTRSFFVVGMVVAAQAAVVKEYVRVDGSTDKAPPPGTVLQADMFANDSLWNKPDDYCSRLKIVRSGGVLSVEGKVPTNRLDTGWNVSTKVLPLSVRGLGYALSFRTAANPQIRLSGGGGTYSCAVVWYDHGGNRIERDAFPLVVRSEQPARRLLVGSVPLAAESYSLQFGFDRPDLFAGDWVRLGDLSFSVMEKETDPAWTPVEEMEAPRVRVVSATPFKDPKADLQVAIESMRPIDWSKVRFLINGKDATARFVREGNVFTYKVIGQWGRCLHTVDVSFADPESGETKTAHKTILCGEAPKTPVVKLREDGIALVGGEPFFPIGVYSVCRREFNGNSLDKAFEDLKKAGVNTVHSYSETRGEDFLSTADRHGLKVWSAVWKADKAFVEKTRHHPSVLAWYVGDDTAMHAEPFEVYDRSDSVRSADPTRITTQADVMNSGDAVSSYRAFVKTTDVFMPEIYPCHSDKRIPESNCVAVAIRDMKRFRRDVADAKDGRPHAIWPIIQYFDGWNAWKRFPTREELFAMSFATLAHGAHGITWYTYGGFPEPKKNRINRGVTATPEIWRNFTDLTSRIASLVPALVMPVPMQPKPAKVLSGPAKDPQLNESISVSLRRAGCDAYLIAVNSTCAPVSAELDFFDEQIGVAEVLWENRGVEVSGTTAREDFAPFAVHVYHWRTPDVEYVAHQGEEALAPNHSRPAYDFAVKHGLERIKLDIRRTKDGEVVLQHDDTLKAIMRWDAKIKDLTLAEIREKGRCRPRGGFTNETIVTLAEALEYGKQTKKGVWLDFKDYSPELADQVFGICDKAGLGHDRIMVATFTKGALKYVQEHYPDVKRVAHTFIRRHPDGGFTTNSGDSEGKVYKTEDELIAALLRHRDALGLAGFNMPHVIRNGKPLYHTTEKVLRALRKAGCWISIWFVNDPYTGELYRGYGADNFVTTWAERTKREFFKHPEFPASLEFDRIDFGCSWSAAPLTSETSNLKPKTLNLKPKTTTFDVRSFGAVGDGVAKDTVAIQKAIDAAEAAGGGRVALGPGTYVSGSIFLKDNVELHLESGATLKGSPDKTDYNPADICPQNRASVNEHHSGGHLVLAIEKKNVSITGSGRIDGSGPVFVGDVNGRNFPMGPVGWDNQIPWRPGQMVYFVECENVKIEGVSLIDSPYWTCFLHGCTKVNVKGVRIRNRREPLHTHNGDGIDIDCCRDVEVADCDIDSADDSITFRADSSRLKNKQPCENIRVSRCRLSTPCNAMRFGVGVGTVRNVRVKDLEIWDTRVAVNFVSSWSGERGVDFDDILIENLRLDARALCHVYPGKSKTAMLRNVRIANVSGKVDGCAVVACLKSNPFENVTFENVDLDCELLTFNVKNLKLEGGRMRLKALSDAELADYNQRAETKCSYPGHLRIGGTKRGGSFFGGKVVLPESGLCGHQGNFRAFPGNTAEGIADAVRKGVAMVEFDVQRCRSGEFVLMHDGTIDNLTTGQGRISEHTLAELKGYRIKRGKGAYRLATLDEVLDVIPDGGVWINLHCYCGTKNLGDLARHIRARGRLHQTCFCANLHDIEEARKAVPELIANNIERPGPRNRDWTDEECQKFVDDSIAHKCRFLQLCRPWDRKYSDACHAAGIKVIHFKSDDPKELPDLKARGIDFVMTNCPEEMGL